MMMIDNDYDDDYDDDDDDRVSYPFVTDPNSTADSYLIAVILGYLT
jgi:hypothetical protein